MDNYYVSKLLPLMVEAGVHAVANPLVAPAVWLEIAERDFEAFDRSIDVHISSLRKKLGDDPKSPRYIETVRGAGYRMRRPGSESVE